MGPVDIEKWLEENKREILGITDNRPVKGDVNITLEPGTPVFIDGDHFAARWVAEFQHGDEVARTMERAAVFQFLGFGATGARVRIHGAIFGDSGIAPNLAFKSDFPVSVYWDRLEGLTQIGVRATGRPIVPVKAHAAVTG